MAIKSPIVINHAPETSWWTDSAHFYENARRHMNRMRYSTYGHAFQLTKGPNETKPESEPKRWAPPEI